MIGIDIGNQSSFVAVVKDCGVETVDNDYSLRATSSVVAFSSRNRILGVAAANQQTSNLTNTISSFKPLLGLRWEDFFVLDEVQRVPYKLVPHPSGGVAVQVCYFGEERVYSMEHITAMLLTGLKVTTETVLKSVIKNCVMAKFQNANAILKNVKKNMATNVICPHFQNANASVFSAILEFRLADVEIS
ncbi:hypothetical protein Fcan01_17180 [Folsomia candida]|uniref:Uncharacterized protein n=1 Tax=Folsomia candida TaxID=158441 RepID=A0A226DS32_FOLCA|nr:hypothetical protein Fcan01_17180 [Folsomia candida]